MNNLKNRRKKNAKQTLQIKLRELLKLIANLLKKRSIVIEIKHLHLKQMHK